MARPKSNFSQILDALNRDQLLVLADRAEVGLAQRRQVDPIRKTLSLERNKGKVTAKLELFLNGLDLEALRRLCGKLNLDDSGKQRGRLAARLTGFLGIGSSTASDAVGAGDGEATGPSSKIFIVHGHDDHMRAEVEKFLLRVSIGSVVLKNLPNNGMTIIEKLEVHTSPDQCNCAIVLLSPDDVGHKDGHEDSTMFRARQNVIFEFGMVVGRLGRKKVIVLHRGKIDLPTDVGGIVYIPYGNGGHDMLVALAQELRAFGHLIDMNVAFG